MKRHDDGIDVEGKAPSFAFYPNDFAREMELCTLPEIGAWSLMLCKMHNSPHRGFLEHANGEPFTEPDIARLLSEHVLKARTILAELKRKEICSVDQRGCILNRRMVRDTRISEARRAAVNSRKDRQPNAQEELDFVGTNQPVKNLPHPPQPPPQSNSDAKKATPPRSTGSAVNEPNDLQNLSPDFVDTKVVQKGLSSSSSSSSSSFPSVVQSSSSETEARNSEANEPKKPTGGKSKSSHSTTTTEPRPNANGNGASPGDLRYAIHQATGIDPDRKTLDEIQAQLDLKGAHTEDFIRETMVRCGRLRERSQPGFWIVMAKKFRPTDGFVPAPLPSRVPIKCDLCRDTGKSGEAFCACKVGELAQQLATLNATSPKKINRGAK